MKHPALILTLLIFTALACSLSGNVATAPGERAPPAVEQPASSPDGRCGDGVCDGPENAQNCPQDCTLPQENPPTGENGDTSASDPGSESDTYWVTNPTSGARLFVRVIHPQGWSGEALPTLVLIPGGNGSSADFLRTPKKSAVTIADAGFTVVIFDPDGRGQSGGSEDQNGYTHQDGLAEIVQFTAALPEVDGEHIGLVSFSYGITMASGVLARYPGLPVQFLINWEGPANRNDTGGCDDAHTGHLQGQPCDDEDFWVEREASTFALNIQVPYQRLQTESDHAQPDYEHTLVMINNATATEHGGHGIAPWTRLNDLTPNTVYTAGNLPAMIPESTEKLLDELIAQYAQELFALP